MLAKRGMPNSSMLRLAMPANSLNVVATLPISSAPIARAVRRMPKRSRIKAAKPLPDRAHAGGGQLHHEQQHAHHGG